MNAEMLKEKYHALYQHMVASKKTENMKVFGSVMTAMIDDMITSNPSKAEEYISRLESIKWKNYLTPKEAEKIVEEMNPKAPWSREQWKTAMSQHGYELEHEPCYNPCALWVVMNMLMSNSGSTLPKYVEADNLFAVVHDLAVDQLKDADGKFMVRDYFGV